jgi:hypothetical protein
MLTLEKWKTSHMILMRMGENGGANVVVTEVLQKGSGVTSDMFWMHATIENHGVVLEIEAVAVGTDARSPSQICETHI